MKFLNKTLCIILCICTLFLCACSGNTPAGVINYRNGSKVLYSFDTGFMYFWISLQKSMYSSVAQSYEDGWEHIIDSDNNTTLYDLLMTESRESAKRLISVEYIHDKVYEIQLSDKQNDSIEKQVDNLVSRYGSKNALDSALSRYGADTDTLRRYYSLMLKQNNLYSYFYDEGGVFAISEEAKQKYFNDNYSIADHIFFKFPTKQDVESNDADLATLKAQKKKTASEVFSAIKSAGADFDTLKEQYDEDVHAKELYPYGFFVTNDSSFPPEFTSAVLGMSVGDIATVETPDTGIHIIRKKQMDSSLYNAYESVEASINDALCAEDFSKRIDGYTSNVTINEGQFASFDPKLIPEFSLN